MPSTVAAALAAVPRNYLSSALVGGKLRLNLEVFTLASDAVGSYAIGHPLPAGAVVHAGFLLTTVSLGTTTAAIGIAGATGKYRAAATFTAVDTPTLFGVAANTNAVLTAQEQLLLTTAVAALPASGTLVIGVIYSLPN